LCTGGDERRKLQAAANEVYEINDYSSNSSGGDFFLHYAE
jgi:hypothetical protein